MPPGTSRESGSSPAPPLHLADLPGQSDRVSQPAATPEHPTRSPSRTPIALSFGVAALALASWLVSSPTTGSLRGLPADQRTALVERTRANLRDVCQGPERPREFCREQAMMVLQMTECDGVCREEARAVLMADSAVR